MSPTMLPTWKRSSNSVETHGDRSYLACCKRPRPTSGRPAKPASCPSAWSLRGQVWLNTLGAWIWKVRKHGTDTNSHRSNHQAKTPMCVKLGADCSVVGGCTDIPLQQLREENFGLGGGGRAVLGSPHPFPPAMCPAPQSQDKPLHPLLLLLLLSHFSRVRLCVTP